MKDSLNRATIVWLMRDTFRQSIASGIFAVLLTVSLVSIAVCLSAGVSGPSTLVAEGEANANFVPRRDSDAADAAKLKTSGVMVANGRLTLAFGAIDVPLARDTQGGVHLLELVLAGGVADTLGLLLTVIWTAGFLPSFLEGRNISVLLAKPAPRWVLIFGKYLGVLCFVLFHATILVGGTWVAIGLRTDYWNPTYLLCVPLLLLQFSIFFGFSVLLAVCTQNAVVCVFGTILFWGVAWSMNFGRHALVMSTDLVSESFHSSYFSGLLEFGYWVFPKPADLGLLLFNSLGAGDHFGPLLDFNGLVAHGFSMTLSVVSSLALTAFLLVISARKFQLTDY